MHDIGDLLSFKRHMRIPARRGSTGGFTLIELIVVISLISLMLSFSMPRIHEAVFVSDIDRLSRWIMGYVPVLKEKSAREQKLYTLHVDFNAGRLWVSNESMAEEAFESAMREGIEIPENIRLIDVEYPGKGKMSSGRADICFYRNSYSDKALIRFRNRDDSYLSFLIEPFMPRVKRIESYADFES
jgi:prepilin-type N-terminal cleavage/methylation domain-containing protein